MSDIADALVEIFKNFRKEVCTKEDKFETDGKAVWIERADHYINRDEPVEFVMPAFPVKSPNHTVKTLGDLPDGAEEVALRNFVRFAALCQEVYKPGVIIRVVTDGLVFSDIVGVAEETAVAYHDRCVEMAADTPIELMTVLDFFKDDLSRETALKIMLGRFGDTEETVRQRIKEDPDTTMLYRGLSRFMSTDIVWPEGLSNTQIQKRAKLVGMQLLLRSEAYSRFITHHFPRAIRLSCHPSTNAGKKFSWQFIPGNKSWNTPWHNCLCVIDGEYSLMKRSDAEALGLELIYKGDQPYYFRDEPSSADLI